MEYIIFSAIFLPYVFVNSFIVGHFLWEMCHEHKELHLNEAVEYR